MEYRPKQRTLILEESKMTERHLRKCSPSLVIREMQTETTLRFHLTLVRMAKIKNTDDNLCWRGCGKREHFCIAGENANWYSTFGCQCDRFLRKLVNTLPQDSVIPLLGIYPKDAQSCHQVLCSTMFIAALFVIARTWKQPKCPLIKEWIRKCGIFTQQSTTQQEK